MWILFYFSLITNGYNVISISAAIHPFCLLGQLWLWLSRLTFWVNDLACQSWMRKPWVICLGLSLATWPCTSLHMIVAFRAKECKGSQEYGIVCISCFPCRAVKAILEVRVSYQDSSWQPYTGVELKKPWSAGSYNSYIHTSWYHIDRNGQ